MLHLMQFTGLLHATVFKLGLKPARYVRFVVKDRGDSQARASPPCHPITAAAEPQDAFTGKVRIGARRGQAFGRIRLDGAPCIA